jgi:outer membrane biosynthesis protein TonB
MTDTTLPSASRGVGIAGTTLAHGALLALVFIAARRATTAQHIVYEVNLVAAPMPSAGPRSAATAAAPVARPVAPPVTPKAVKPAVKKPPAPAKRSDLTPAVKAPVVPAQGEKPSTGHDVVTLHQAGITFPFPDYLNNIENMVYKRWNHSMFRPGLEARIAFVISKDGSVPVASYVVEKSSGNSTFDEYARTAIESVVANHEFGPLPDGFAGASLPILFVFTQVARSTP